ncbi:MAG TPA: hypothetical protein VN222_09075 [Novosphingobium sp.]|nr:hypothetical protein [Novosphingobium sp.]
MSATPPDSRHRHLQPANDRPDEAAGHLVLDAQWAALSKAASAIAALAGPQVVAQARSQLTLPPSMYKARDRRGALIAQTLADLVAVMEPGLKALLEVHARGADAAPPALALWHEFVSARTALLALAPAAPDPTQAH